MPLVRIVNPARRLCGKVKHNCRTGRLGLARESANKQHFVLSWEHHRLMCRAGSPHRRGTYESTSRRVIELGAADRQSGRTHASGNQDVTRLRKLCRNNRRYHCRVCGYRRGRLGIFDRTDLEPANTVRSRDVGIEKRCRRDGQKRAKERLPNCALHHQWFNSRILSMG